MTVSDGQTEHASAQAASVDAALVMQVRQGELSAFDELVGRYQRRATAVAYRMLNNRDDAMEVTQDAFLKAFDRLDTLENPERFGSWLLRILSNLALNRRRGRALRKMASLETTDSDGEAVGPVGQIDPKAVTPLERAAGDDLKGKIRRAIDALPDMQRQALVLFSIEKIPQKEVAEILECSVEAVKWHVFTARKKLREQLSGDL